MSPAVVADPVPGIMTDQTSGPTSCKPAARSSSMEQERNRLRSLISRHPKYREDRRSFLGTYDGLGALPKHKLVALATTLGIDTAGLSQRSARGIMSVSSVRNRACVSAIEDPSDVPSLAASSPSPSGRSVASSTSSPSSRPAQQSSSVTCQQSLREQQQQQQQQQLRHIGIDFPSTFLTGFTPLGSDQFHPLSVDSMSMTPCEFPEPRPVTLGLGTAEALGFASSADFMDIPIDIAQPNSPFSSFFNSSTPRPAGSPPPSNLAAFQTTDASATEPVAPSLKTLSHSDVRTFLEDVFKPDPIPESISKAFNENAVDMEVVRSSHFTSDLLVRHLKLSVADAMRIIEARIDITAVRSA